MQKVFSLIGNLKPLFIAIVLTFLHFGKLMLFSHSSLGYILNLYALFATMPLPFPQKTACDT
jgi:hypothetical protein